MKLGRKVQYGGILNIPEGTRGDVTVKHLHHPAGTTLSTGTLRTAFMGQPSSDITFDRPTVWHELSSGEHGVWMTDLPIEQRQMDTLIHKSHGRVLVGGLGLGYVVVALAAKKLVREIVVVERSQDVIDLVWRSTANRMHRRDLKLKIVKADLFEFLTTQPRKPHPVFSWGLFDIWQADGETTFHEFIVPLRKLAYGVVGKLECWNEDIMRAQLLQGLTTRLLLLRQPPAMAGSEQEWFRSAYGLNALRIENGNLYMDWAVPLWRWVFKKYGDDPMAWPMDRVKFAAMAYAKSYGLPQANNGLSWLTFLERRW